MEILVVKEGFMDIVTILLIVLAAVLLLALVILPVAFVIAAWICTDKIRRDLLSKRFDDDGTLHYFSCEDFSGLKKREYSFYSGGNRLQGYLYFCEETTRKPLIVFSHGLGAGHIQYMSEIAFFAQRGYSVFTYDVRGCYRSEGSGIDYMSNALLDLDAALTFLEAEPEFASRPRVLMGHSMGGYCVNAVAAFAHPDIVGAVSMAGFDSTYTLIRGYAGKRAWPVAVCFRMQEKRKNGTAGSVSSMEALRKTSYPVLLISGDKDPLVAPEWNFDRIRDGLKGQSNLSFLVAEGRYHRPNLSLSAAEYDVSIHRKISRFNETHPDSAPEEEIRALYDSFDYRKLVEFDPEIMNRILEFLDRLPRNS